MPKNQFQRPQPIKHAHNVPRHGLQQAAPPKKLPAKATGKSDKPDLPPLEKLLQSQHRH